jgi:uracil phosphoribosyltransferase
MYVYRFKSPLIQSLLNKARNTRSTDNLVQTSMTASQIMTESMADETMTAAKSTTTPTDLSDDDHEENSRMNNNSNGHPDLQ